MSQKPETKFINKVDRHIPEVYAEKTNNPFRGGIADKWYSGDRGDLWVEYKYLPRIPMTKRILPDLSPRQQLWLAERHTEGRNVAVVVGCPQGGVIYRNLEWMSPLSAAEFRLRLQDCRDIALWIKDQVGSRVCLYLDLSSSPPRFLERSIKSSSQE